jgi:hypothetical protein
LRQFGGFAGQGEIASGGLMDTVHMVNGTLVLLGYLALAAGFLLQLRRGRALPWVRPLSRIAGTLLLVQFALGFILLTTDHSVTPAHYITALSSVVPVGFGDSVQGSDRSQEAKSRLGAIAAAATVVVVLIAYLIGQAD